MACARGAREPGRMHSGGEHGQHGPGSELERLRAELEAARAEAERARRRAEELEAAVAGGGVPPETRARLQLGGSEPADPARAMEVCGLLADLAVSLDQVMWTAWSKNIAPRSSVKRSAPLARTMGRYVAGDPEVSRAALSADVDSLKRLSAALIAAVGRVGRLFAQRHLQKYAVQAIEDAAPSPGFMKNREAACWQHYVKLMSGVEDESINQEIMQLIAESVEQVLRGRMGGS